MSGPEFVVLSHVVIDDLELSTGERLPGRLGGAGTYAAAGIRMVNAGQVGISCGVGADFETHRSWLRRWNIAENGLFVRGTHTPHTQVRYLPDGERVESPSLGSAHFNSMRPIPADIPASWTSVRGAYVFAQADPDLLGQVRQALGTKVTVLWEVSAESCTPMHLDLVGRLAADVDWFSLNLTEARSLCGDLSPSQLVALLHRVGVPRISLRLGPAGTILSDGSSGLHIRATPVARVVDPTGAGNCHSAALLAAWMRSGSLLDAGRWAAAAASYVIQEFGPPVTPPTDAQMHRWAAATAAELLVAEDLDVELS